MRRALLGLTLLALNSCNANQEDQVRDRLVKSTHSAANPTVELNGDLLSDINYWIKNGIKYEDQKVILQRCGYQIKRTGFFGRLVYVTDGNNSSLFNEDIVSNLSAVNLQRFVESYNK